MSDMRFVPFFGWIKNNFCLWGSLDLSAYRTGTQQRDWGAVQQFRKNSLILYSYLISEQSSSNMKTITVVGRLVKTDDLL